MLSLFRCGLWWCRRRTSLSNMADALVHVRLTLCSSNSNANWNQCGGVLCFHFKGLLLHPGIIPGVSSRVKSVWAAMLTSTSLRERAAFKLTRDQTLSPFVCGGVYRAGLKSQISVTSKDKSGMQKNHNCGVLCVWSYAGVVFFP